MDNRYNDFDFETTYRHSRGFKEPANWVPFILLWGLVLIMAVTIWG